MGGFGARGTMIDGQGENLGRNRLAFKVADPVGKAAQALPFVAVARAKGASRNWVLWKHVARNAILPTLTIAGILPAAVIYGIVKDRRVLQPRIAVTAAIMLPSSEIDTA